MNRYQILLLVVLLAWPLVIFGILYLMSKLEDWVRRVDAESPQEAGSPNGKGDTVAQNSGPEQGGMGRDGVIQDQREVFEIAREFGLFEGNQRAEK
jgi:hypothetical protein